ncbi:MULTISPECIES: nucleotidyltransferase family protein [unclassified Adlercreutzia]|uniref:nucleotidyltransferase family protein n=1 Tax=unclassified Adlercreutzia TaxID=2636013 RepID=UPI0013ECF491|nr:MULTISPECIES: nucleotidyltransferase family protein [unclassified Adlercreutzia]
MAQPISIYLSDDTLVKLDELVRERAEQDRCQGLEGRQVTNRSKLIGRLIDERFGERPRLATETIRYAVVDLARQYGAAKVSLFGSYARGEARPDSDVDILLEKGAIKGMQVLDFQEDLSRVLGRPVDVVTTAGASKRFLERIKPDAIVLYEAA